MLGTSLFVTQRLFNPLVLSRDNDLTSREKKRVSREFPSEMVQILQVNMMRSLRGIRRSFLLKELLPDPKLLPINNDLMPQCEILRRCGRAKSSEPKDKIFALISMSNKASRAKRPLLFSSPMPMSASVFSIDYSMPDAYIFIKCTLSLLTKESPLHRTLLNILPLAGIGYTRKINRLPSWVLDWSSLPEAWTLSFDRRDIWNYRASSRICNH